MAIFYGRQNILYQLLLYSSFAIIIYYRLLTEHTSGIRKSSESSGNYDLPYLSRNKVVDLLDISLPKNSSKIWIKEHFSQLGKSLARPFVEQPRQVCSLRPMIENKNIEKDGLKLVSPEGFFYVKMPKAASSTLAGMNTRIAIKQGQRLHHKNATLAPHNTTSCTHYEDHVIGAGMWYGNREPTKSFLWTSLRDPASRAISRVFFTQVSQFGRPPTDEKILSALHKDTKPQGGTISDGQGGFQLRYLSLEPIKKWSAWNETAPTSVQDPEAIQRNIKQVIQKYDFLALTERLDESLVAMQLLLDLPVSDILSTSSKVGGGYFYVKQKGKSRCVPLQKSFRSPAVQAYLESDEWYAQNYGDYLLYAAANHSLDMTIERLGKERFSGALQEYRDALKLVKEECDAKTSFPCSASGRRQPGLSKENCYQGDEGCGYPCIDELENQKLWQHRIF